MHCFNSSVVTMVKHLSVVFNLKQVHFHDSAPHSTFRHMLLLNHFPCPFIYNFCLNFLLYSTIFFFLTVASTQILDILNMHNVFTKVKHCSIVSALNKFILLIVLHIHHLDIHVLIFTNFPCPFIYHFCLFEIYCYIQLHFLFNYDIYLDT